VLAWLSVWSEVQTCIVAQLMPLPLTVSCFSKIQIGFTFFVPVHPGSLGKGPLNVCVCGRVSLPCLQCSLSGNTWDGPLKTLNFIHRLLVCACLSPQYARVLVVAVR